MNKPVGTDCDIEIAEIMLELSDHIVNAEANELIPKLEEALIVIGRSFAVDKAYIALYDSEMHQEKKIINWSAAQGLLSSDYVEILNLSEFTWWEQLALENEEINISSIDIVPAHALNEQAYYLRNHIKSNLELNLRIKDTLVGFIGFEMLSHERSWSIHEVRTLRFMGNICLGAILQCNTKDKLNSIINQQEFLVDISNGFIHIAIDRIDTLITETLQRVALQNDADRIYIDLFDANDSSEKLDFEYVRPSLEGRFDAMHDLNLSDFPWWQKQMEKGSIITIASPLDFPPDATTERNLFLDLGIISNMEINMYDEDRLIGFLGFEFMLKQHTWLESEISFIKLLAEIISSALIRKEIQKKLNNRLKFESMLFKISNMLHHSTMDNHIAQMRQVLSMISKHIMAERGYIYTGNGTPEQPTQMLCCWTAHNVKDKSNLLPSSAMYNYTWWQQQRANSQSILVNNISILPPEAVTEKSYYRGNGIYSHLELVLSSNGSILGNLCFESFSSPQQWDAEMLNRIRLTGDIFAAVLARLKTEIELSENNKLLLEAQEIGHIGSWEWDTKLNKWAWSDEIYRILGYRPGEITPNSSVITQHLHPNDRRRLFGIMSNTSLTASKNIETSFRIILNDGKEKHIYLRARRNLGEKNALRICGTIQDITIQKLHEDELRYISLHDRLTGIENRTAYEDFIRGVLSEKNLPLSLISGDVNGLKLINDSFGHSEGDKLLKRISSIMRSCLRTGDRIFRTGGDEFMIFLPNTDIQAAELTAERMREHCRKAKTSYKLPLSISFGIHSVETRGSSIASMLKEAEDRMYQNKLLESKSARNSVIASLQETLAEKTFETEAHSKRLQCYSVLISNALRLSSSERDQLMLLSALHDIGKIAVAESILLKAGALSNAEWLEIKKHPETGYRIAQATPELAPVALAILAHHERWDGKGYPQGLAKDTIPLLARIITIVDAFDVMINGRPYKTPMGTENALLEIENCAGSQFDPDLSRIFVQEMRRTHSTLCI